MATAAHVTARFLIDQAGKVGVEGAALAELGLAAGELEQPGRVPIARMYRAWGAVRRATGDPAIGVRAAHGWALDELGLFGFCVAAAPTLRDGVATAAALIGLVTDSGAWRIEDRPGEQRLIWQRSGPAGDGFAVSNEVMVAAFARCLRGLWPRLALRVAWRHPRWSARPAHAELLGCEVGFGAPDDAIAIPARELAAASPGANPTLWRYLCALAEREVGAFDEPSAAVRTRAAIDDALARHGGRPDAAAIARSLGTSERSLRRRLAEEGTTLRALLAEACLERGAARLAQRGSVTDAALDSGFSDGSAFARAWRRRHGRAPRRA